MASHRRYADQARAESLSDSDDPNTGAAGAMPPWSGPLQPRMSREGWQQLEVDLKMLPDAVAKEILVQFARQLPGVALSVIDKCDELRLQEARTERNYDSCARETVIYLCFLVLSLHTPLSSFAWRMRSGDEYDAALDVDTEIGKMFQKMESEIKPHSSFSSKHSALNNMLEMFETIMKCVDGVGDIVRHGPRCSEWEDLFLRVLGRLTPDELPRLGEGNTSWLWKLDIVVEYASEYGLFGRIAEAYNFLNAEVISD
ncbi:hypothetical protein PG984_012201 [Apiospora sp. TS-2023a]